jgi:predicted RNA binding protein YcfA (HicA-like mRNA interferase family)
MIKEGDSMHQPIIPLHKKDLPKGTLRAIIKQLNLTVDEFIEYL